MSAHTCYLCGHYRAEIAAAKREIHMALAANDRRPGTARAAHLMARIPDQKARIERFREDMAAHLIEIGEAS